MEFQILFGSVTVFHCLYLLWNRFLPANRHTAVSKKSHGLSKTRWLLLSSTCLTGNHAASFVKVIPELLDMVHFQTWQFYLTLHQTSYQNKKNRSLSRPFQVKSNKGTSSFPLTTGSLVPRNQELTKGRVIIDFCPWNGPALQQIIKWLPGPCASYAYRLDGLRSSKAVHIWFGKTVRGSGNFLNAMQSYRSYGIDNSVSDTRPEGLVVRFKKP